MTKSHISKIIQKQNYKTKTIYQNMVAALAPRRSSFSWVPVAVSKILIRVPFSEAVANFVPGKLRARKEESAGLH